MRAPELAGDVRVRLYGALVILVATPAMVVVVKSIGYTTEEWYYLPFMALVAIAAEAGLWGRGAGPPIRIARVALAVLIVASSLPALWPYAHLRRTNVDLIADRLHAEESETDLILVSPFWYGVSFHYYYHGDAPWLGLPGVTPERVGASYPVIHDLMMLPDPMRPILARMRETLERGGRVWFVGGYSIPRGAAPPMLGPAPHATYGWYAGAFATSWSLQAGAFVREHALRSVLIPIASPRPVSPFEDVALVMVEGWRQP